MLLLLSERIKTLYNKSLVMHMQQLTHDGIFIFQKPIHGSYRDW
jgi:hypothetical protein